jgi:hypothetical protein
MCAESVLDVAPDDHDWTPAVAAVQGMVEDRGAFLKSLSLAVLQADKKDKAANPEHDALEWSETPCTCDAHYSKVPAWQMTKKGQTAGLHRHRDRDWHCTVCGAESDRPAKSLSIGA